MVKHRRRFFFQSEELEDDELYSPLALLKELTAWCERYDLVKPFPAGSPLYRARHQKLGETLVTATELGPPPQEKTTISNRMSPPGIVMFYVSDNPETALRETATSADTFAIGKFRTRREANFAYFSAPKPMVTPRGDEPPRQVSLQP